MASPTTIIDSTKIYRPLWRCFRLMAPTFFGSRSWLVYVLMLLFHLLITCCFPLHLLLGLLQQPEPEQLFSNLTLSIMCAACSLKHVSLVRHLPHIREIESLLVRLDKRVESGEERRNYEEKLERRGRRLTRLFYASYVVVYSTFALAMAQLIFGKKRELLYTAWLPFEWQSGEAWRFVLAMSYQTLAIVVEAIQGLTNDIYPSLTLLYLAGHTQLLAVRVARLGHGQLERQPHRPQLLACIEDHKLLMRLYQLMRQTINHLELIQLAACGASLCIAMFFVLFYARDYVVIVHYISLLGVVLMQLFPSCYYASMLAEESQRLSFAIFSSNWSGQSAQHRRDVLIFTQLTVRAMTVKVGGIILLDLNAFITTLKMAYSLFAVVVRFK